MMAELITRTSENFCQLSPTYLRNSFWFLMLSEDVLFSSSQSSYPAANHIHRVCPRPLAQSRNFSQLGVLCRAVKGQADECVPSSAVFLTSYVTSSISFNHSGPQFPQLQTERIVLDGAIFSEKSFQCSLLTHTHTSWTSKNSVASFYDWYLI